jgi:hypothetical protein
MLPFSLLVFFRFDKIDFAWRELSSWSVILWERPDGCTYQLGIALAREEIDRDPLDMGMILTIKGPCEGC